MQKILVSYHLISLKAFLLKQVAAQIMDWIRLNYIESIKRRNIVVEVLHVSQIEIFLILSKYI